VIRPGRTNYSELIEPLRPIPAALSLADLQGRAVEPGSLRGQWLLMVVAGGACDASCERLLWLQPPAARSARARQGPARQGLAVDDARHPPETLQAVMSGTAVTVLRSGARRCRTGSRRRRGIGSSSISTWSTRSATG